MPVHVPRPFRHSAAHHRIGPSVIGLGLLWPGLTGPARAQEATASIDARSEHVALLGDRPPPLDYRR